MNDQPDLMVIKKARAEILELHSAAPPRDGMSDSEYRKACEAHIARTSGILDAFDWCCGQITFSRMASGK